MELNTDDLTEKFLVKESENLQKHIKTDQNIGLGRKNGKNHITKPIKILPANFKRFCNNSTVVFMTEAVTSKLSISS